MEPAEVKPKREIARWKLWAILIAALLAIPTIYVIQYALLILSFFMPIGISGPWTPWEHWRIEATIETPYGPRSGSGYMTYRVRMNRTPRGKFPQYEYKRQAFTIKVENKDVWVLSGNNGAAFEIMFQTGSGRSIGSVVKLDQRPVVLATFTDSKNAETLKWVDEKLPGGEKGYRLLDYKAVRVSTEPPHMDIRKQLPFFANIYPFCNFSSKECKDLNKKGGVAQPSYGKPPLESVSSSAFIEV